MAYTQNQLIDRVSAKIDEVLPPVEGVEAEGMREASVNFIDEVLDKSAEFILHNAPKTMVRQVGKKANKHFPISPAAFTGLISVGGTNVVNQVLTSINSVSYNINGSTYGLNPMPVTVNADPSVGFNRRDIIVGNSLNQLEYIAGNQSATSDSLDYPNVPSGKVLVMKVLILDDTSGGFTKTYISGPTSGSGSNPSTRLIYNQPTGVSIVPCPTDFLRFLSIELSDWEVPATELIEEGDPKYRLQKNNSLLRGTAKKPKAALVGFTDYLQEEINALHPNKGTAIECFSSKEEPTITRFIYVPKTTAVNMPDDLIDAVCWEAASRTLFMMQQPDKAAVARQQVLIYFNNKYGLIGEAK